MSHSGPPAGVARSLPEPSVAAHARDPGQKVAVKIERLVKSYGATRVVHGIDFDVEAGSTVTLLGPSGCGKTTTLRCIAGLEHPSGGRIVIDNRTVYDSGSGVFVKPEARKIGMVFQSYAIWPHMTVGGNVGFPLAIAGKRRQEVRDRTADILQVVGLQDFMNRPASQLSGGQQQRVALARALVHEPNIVLFDEPLSNLDANLRERMRMELQLLQARLRFTAVYVTHDQEEALSLSDKVIVLNQGRIEQLGTPQEVFQHPRSEFTARFLGCSNILTGKVVSLSDDRLAEIAIDRDTMLSASWRADERPAVGDRAVVGFRGDQVRIAEPGVKAGRNTITGEVATATFLGTRFDYTINVRGAHIRAIGGIERPCARGQIVAVEVAVAQCHAYPAAPGT